MKLADRWVVPTVYALCAVPVAYALQRLAQAQFFPEPDPRSVIPGPRIAMYWRLYAAVPVAGVLAFVIAGLRARWAEPLKALVPHVVLLSALIATLQGVFVP